MDTTMKTAAKGTHFFINTEFGPQLPVTQLVSFLEKTHILFYYSH